MKDSGLIKWGDYFDALPYLNAAVSKTWCVLPNKLSSMNQFTACLSYFSSVRVSLWRRTPTANRFLSSSEKQGNVGNKIEKLPIKSDVPAPNVDGGDSQHKIFIA